MCRRKFTPGTKTGHRLFENGYLVAGVFLTNLFFLSACLEEGPVSAEVGSDACVIIYKYSFFLSPTRIKRSRGSIDRATVRIGVGLVDDYSV